MPANTADTADRTTLSVRQATHELLAELKPYESMSYDEFLRELAEEHAEQCPDGGGVTRRV